MLVRLSICLSFCLSIFKCFQDTHFFYCDILIKLTALFGEGPSSLFFIFICSHTNFITTHQIQQWFPTTGLGTASARQKFVNCSLKILKKAAFQYQNYQKGLHFKRFNSVFLAVALTLKLFFYRQVRPIVLPSITQYNY